MISLIKKDKDNFKEIKIKDNKKLKNKLIDDWINLILKVLKEGNIIWYDNEKIKELFNQTLIINSKHSYEPLNILNKITDHTLPSIEEIKENILYCDKYKKSRYHYGNRIRKPIDQLKDYVIPLLKENKLTRRSILSFWNSILDAKLNFKEYPSLLNIQFFIRNNKINAITNIRSCDLVFGFSSNLIQVFSLTEYISKELNVDLGIIYFNMMNAHVYLQYKEIIIKLISYIYNINLNKINFNNINIYNINQTNFSL